MLPRFVLLMDNAFQPISALVQLTTLEQSVKRPIVLESHPTIFLYALLMVIVKITTSVNVKQDIMAQTVKISNASEL